MKLAPQIYYPKRSRMRPDVRNRLLALYRSADARGATQLGLVSLLLPIGGLAANIVFARTLGASGRGDIAAVVAALAVCDAVLAFGLPDILARHTARASLPAGVARALATGAIMAGIIPGALLAMYCHSRNFSWPVAAVAGATVPVATAIALGKGVLNGRQDYGRLSVALLFNGVARFAAPAVLLLADHPSENLALIFVLAAIVAPAVPILASRPFGGSRVAVRASWPILRESLNVWPTYLAWQVNATLDQLLLAIFASSDNLGRYAVCVGIAQIPGVMAIGLRNVVLVRVARSNVYAGIPIITAVVILLSTVVGVLAALYADPLIIALLGSEFGSTSWVLGILLIATGFDVAAGIATSCLIALGHGRSVTFCYVIGLFITAALLPPAIMLGGGIISAAIIRLISSALPYCLALFLLRRLNRSDMT